MFEPTPSPVDVGQTCRNCRMPAIGGIVSSHPEAETAQPDDYHVCYHCQELSFYDAAMKLQALDDKHRAEIADDARLEMLLAIAKVTIRRLWEDNNDPQTKGAN